MSTTDLLEFENADAWDGDYRITGCRRALSPSGLPGIDYALNPYGGCEHGCIYCYAPEVTRSDWEDWRVVKVRANIAGRLAAELPGLTGTVGIGTVTDPYQAAEARFCLTRSCLEVLRERDMPVHIHTKSDLILRDLGMLSEMRSEVGITLTGLDERFSKITEPGAPLPGRRLEALRRLSAEGIDAYALIGPVLDHLEGHEREFTDAIIGTGVGRAVIDRLNARPQLSARLDRKGMKGSDIAKERVRASLLEAGIPVEDAF